MIGETKDFGRWLRIEWLPVKTFPGRKYRKNLAGWLQKMYVVRLTINHKTSMRSAEKYSKMVLKLYFRVKLWGGFLNQLIQYVKQN